MIIRKRVANFAAGRASAMMLGAPGVSSRVCHHRDSSARRRRPGRAGPDRYRESLAAPGHRRVAEHHWRGRHVVGGGCPARHPGRFRRRPCRCRAALHARHARLRRRRRGHGPARRPLRHRRAAGAGTLALGLGYLAVGQASTLWQVALAHGLLIGIGCSATFGPLIADLSHWFVRRRGIAVAIAASGNYLAGTFWPPVVQHFIATSGWRSTHTGIGLFLLVSMLPLVYFLRQRMQAHHTEAATQSAARRQAELPFSPATLQVLLCIAGIACCVAMSMPQVHLVAYCGDLGYGAARGAEMLSLMLGFGIVSRIASGFIADRIGGVRTLLLGSVLQGTALFLYLFFDGLTSLYVISALFGLFQGGIVPSYAIIVREYFPPREAGTRIGLR